MIFSEEELAIVRKHESSFVSLHYLPDETSDNKILADETIYDETLDHNSQPEEGHLASRGLKDKNTKLLQAIEVAASSLVDTTPELSKSIFTSCGVELHPIAGKNFRNLFRSHPTTSFYCCNNNKGGQMRQQLSNKLTSIEADGQLTCFYQYQILLKRNADQINNYPIVTNQNIDDPYVNFRVDCLDYLQSVNIKTHSAYYLGEDVSAVIFAGNNIIDLLDNYILVDYIAKNIASNYGFEVAHKVEMEHKIYFGNEDSFVNLRKSLPNSVLSPDYSLLLPYSPDSSSYKTFLGLF